MASNYISLKQVADRVLRNPMMAGVSFEAIIDYAIDFMRIVQCGGFFTEKCTTIEIENYKGLIPNDFYEVNQIRLINTAYKVPKYKQDSYINEEGVEVLLPSYTQVGYEEYTEATSKSFRSATDTFHLSDRENHYDLTYKLHGGYIFTSIKEGVIEMSYRAILVDEEGFPLIPDNSKFTRALEAYIKLQWYTILFEMGKLQQAVYQNTHQMYAWAVGACESEFQKMSLDKAESFFNSWRSIIPRVNEHSVGYASLGTRQNLKFN